jgi:nitrogen fixation/metabolism regulation signal transduction histidine kinase
MLRFPLIRQFLLIAAVACLLLVAQNAASVMMLHPGNDDARQWITYSSVVMLVVLLLAGFVYSRVVSLKLRKILRGIQAVQRGEYPRLLADRQDDIGDIIKGFNQMVEELRARDEKLQSWATKAETQVEALSHTVQAEREKLGTVLDSIGEGVIVLDSDSKVLMANWRVGEIFGVPMDALRASDLRMLIETCSRTPISWVRSPSSSTSPAANPSASTARRCATTKASCSVASPLRSIWGKNVRWSG